MQTSYLTFLRAIFTLKRCVLVVLLMLAIQVVSLHYQIAALPHQPTVVTVNVTGLVNNYITQLAKSDLTPEQTKAQITDFSQRLESALQRLSEKDHVIVFPSQAILAGAPDQTAELVKLMQSKQVNA